MDTEIEEPALTWYRTPLDKETLRGLTRRSDARGLLYVVPHLLLVAASGAAAFAAAAWLPWWTLVPILFVHGSLWAFLANGFHELTHGTMFRSKAVGGAFLRAYSFLTWNNHVLYRASHSRHHLYTLHPPADSEVVLPMRLTLVGFLGTAVVDPVGWARSVASTVRLAFGRLSGEWENALFPSSAPGERRRLFAWARITVVGHGLVIAFSAVTGWWLAAVLVTGGNLFGRWVFFLNTYAQHTGLKDNVEDFRLCTRSIRHNPVLSWLYFQMNYHAEHHMYASVPCYNLPRLRAAIDHDMPPRHSMLGAWREIIGILRRQARDPGYQHEYALPGAR